MIRAAVIIAAAAVVTTLLVSMVLPVYLESRLLPDLIQKFGLTADQIRIRRIGLGGIDAGPVTLTRQGQPALEITAVGVDYSLPGLLHGDIDGIYVSGLHTTVDIGDKTITVAGLTLPVPDAQAPAEPETKAAPFPMMAMDKLIPIELKDIHIQNTIIDLRWRGIPIQVPLDIRLSTADLSRGRLKAELNLYPRGNAVKIELAVNQADNQVTLSLVRCQVLLQSMADLLALPTPMDIGGTIETTGYLSAQLNPFEIKAAGISGEVTRVRLRTGALTLTTADSADTAGHPVDFQAELKGMNELTWSCGPFDITGPMTLHAQQLKGKMLKQNGLWRLESSGRIQLPSQAVVPAPYLHLTVQQGTDHDLDLNARQTDADTIGFTLATRPRDPDARLMAGLTNLMLESKPPRLAMEGTYSQNHLESHLNLSLAGLLLPLTDGRLQCPVFDITADTDVDFSDPRTRIGVQARIGATDLSAVSGTAHIFIPQISLATHLFTHPSEDAESTLSIATRLKIDNARIMDKTRGLNIRGMDIDLPMQWPPPRQGQKGRIGVRSMVFQKRELGNLNGSLMQQQNSLVMDAQHQSKLLEKLDVLIKAKADIKGVAVDFSIPAVSIGPDMDLGRFAPQAAGFKLNGTIQAKGRLDIAPGGVNGSISARLTNGRLQQTELDLDLSGMEADMHVEDLINLRSGPRQQLRIEKLRFGDITADQLQVDFQLEPEQTLFIESAEMKWCRGLINTNAVRIRPGEDDIDLTLICDRLNLAMVLQQLGAAEGSGDGAVNGVIPIRWAKGKLHFDKGFLYSTPGQTGTIALGGTEFLLEGLPKASPQHTQLDIATEALKDYTYNWAKLSLESDEDILLIKLQLDGKPNRLLPFGYDKKLGTLMRVQGEGQAEFKGINIDLNFKSPINEILNYQELLKKR